MRVHAATAAAAAVSFIAVRLCLWLAASIVAPPPLPAPLPLPSAPLLCAGGKCVRMCVHVNRAHYLCEFNCKIFIL